MENLFRTKDIQKFCVVFRWTVLNDAETLTWMEIKLKMSRKNERELDLNGQNNPAVVLKWS